VITSYTLENGRLRPTAGETPETCFPARETPASVWINLVNPTDEECDAVGIRFGIPLEHLRAALDFHERPRMEYDDGILLIVARIPIRLDTQKHVNFGTCPFAIILTPVLGVTVCLRDHPAERLLAEKMTGSGSSCTPERLMLTLLLRISTTFIEHLSDMDEHVDHIERTLHESMQNQELMRMLHVEKSLIYFLTALKGNHSVMEKMRNLPFLAGNDNARDLLDDALIENKQATDTAEIFTQIMGSLSDAFGAIVSNNLNKVMKVLTGLTIVFMVPSIIGGLYGMNVPLPLQDKPFAFAGLCVVCLGLSVLVYRVLRKMNWM
jgi:magnesium transporter